MKLLTELSFSPGIYQITHIQSGKRYIGSAVSLKNRYRQHRCGLNGGYHKNPILSSYWKKYGEESFSFEVLELCEVELLIHREQFYIDTLNPEFNVDRVAGSRLGSVQTTAAKRKTVENRKVSYSDPTYRKMMSDIKKKAWEGDDRNREICRALMTKLKNDPEIQRRRIESVKSEEFRKKRREIMNSMFKDPNKREEFFRKKNGSICLISPYGDEIEVVNMARWSRSIGVSQSLGSMLKCGHIKSLRGWRLK